MRRFAISLLPILLDALAFAQGLTRSAAHAGAIDNTNIAVIINAADPLSVTVGEYYANARRIPAVNVIRVSFPAGSPARSIPKREGGRGCRDTKGHSGVCIDVGRALPRRVYVHHQCIRFWVRSVLLRERLHADKVKRLLQLSQLGSRVADAPRYDASRA
jgi:hypothetical protein